MCKVVLISTSGYSSEHEPLLLSFLERKYELFCAVGKECELWENVMDELALDNGENSQFITTTSHPDESETEVIEFAKMFSTKSKGGVHVVRI